MDSMNDEEDGDFIDNSEDNQSQLRVRVASLEKLVDYCAEEFSKSHRFHICFFFLCVCGGGRGSGGGGFVTFVAEFSAASIRRNWTNQSQLGQNIEKYLPQLMPVPVLITLPLV